MTNVGHTMSSMVYDVFASEIISGHVAIPPGSVVCMETGHSTLLLHGSPTSHRFGVLLSEPEVQDDGQGREALQLRLALFCSFSNDYPADAATRLYPQQKVVEFLLPHEYTSSASIPTTCPQLLAGLATQGRKATLMMEDGVGSKVVMDRVGWVLAHAETLCLGPNGIIRLHPPANSTTKPPPTALPSRWIPNTLHLTPTSLGQLVLAVATLPRSLPLYRMTTPLPSPPPPSGSTTTQQGTSASAPRAQGATATTTAVSGESGALKGQEGGDPSEEENALLGREAARVAEEEAWKMSCEIEERGGEEVDGWVASYGRVVDWRGQVSVA